MTTFKKGIKPSVHLIISHPRGNATFNYRIKAFHQILISKGNNVFIPYILYPFQTSYQGITDEISVIEEEKLTTISPEINFIQKIVVWLQKNNFPPYLIKILYAFHIAIFKIDLWHVPIYKAYEIEKLSPEAIRVVIASGGPGSVFKMAYELSSHYSTKLILDYRDPWNFGYDLLGTGIWINKFKRKIMLNEELRILRKADHITVVSESIKSFFPKEFQSKITVIENGSNFEQKEIIEIINPKPKTFSVTYLGTIYNDQLVDETFFIAFSNFLREHQEKISIELKFIGSDKNELLKKVIKKYHLEKNTIITKRKNKDGIMNFLLNTSMFLHLKFKDRSKIISSKNADYLLFRKPILLPVSDNGDLSESIKEYNAGYVCNGVEETLSALSIEYTKFLNRESIVLNQKDLSHLSRTQISKKLLKVIEDL